MSLYFSILSTHLTISDSVRQDAKDGKEQDWDGADPCKLKVGARRRQYCWEQHSKAYLGGLLVYPDSLREDPCQGLEQDISGKFNVRLHP
jgi:hypothetical protein